MSWIAVAVVGVSLMGASAYMKYENAEDQANAVAREGALKAREREKKTLKLAGKQKASFAASGISLTGDEGLFGTFLNDTYDTGMEDINLIKENYNTRAGSVMSGARSQLIGDLGKIALTVSSLGSGLSKPDMGGGGTSQFGNSYGANTPAGTYDMGNYSKITL